jgi:hypothetical protein
VTVGNPEPHAADRSGFRRTLTQFVIRSIGKYTPHNWARRTDQWQERSSLQSIGGYSKRPKTARLEAGDRLTPIEKENFDTPINIQNRALIDPY